MQNNYEIPRVEVPGLTEDDKVQAEAVREEMDWYQRTKAGYLRALLLKGHVFAGKRKSPAKPTKHQRHKATVKARSAYLHREDV